MARPREAAAACTGSYRAAYHFTVPDQWKNDPQRPVWIDGEYHYYYLYNPDYFDGRHHGRHRLAPGHQHRPGLLHRPGIAVPKDTTPNGDVWSGSAVVDHDDTAGFGAGAVIVIATMAPDDDHPGAVPVLLDRRRPHLHEPRHRPVPPQPRVGTSATPR